MLGTRTLQGRLVISYVGLTVALHVLIFHVLGLAMRSSLEQGIERLMEQLVEEDQSFEQALENYATGDFAVERFYFRLFDPQGALTLRKGPDLADAEALGLTLALGGRRADTLEASPGTTLRVLSRRFDDGAVIQAGVLLDEDGDLVEQFAHHWRLGSLSLAVLVGGLSWWMVRSAMAGVKEVTRTAEEILEGSLKARVPERQQVVEVQELTGTINRMLEKIDVLITDLKYVSVDVAHDLRSPLTRLRGAAEMALREEPSREALHGLAERAIDETTRLEAVIETMLEIARLDSGADQLQRESVDPTALMREIMELYSEAAEAKELALQLHDTETPRIEAERTMLRRTVANLLDNAVKFTPRGGSIRLGALEKEGAVVLFVEDSGPGIPATDLPRIFERFFRTDACRKKAGHGLGLSYVKSAVSAHGGTVEILCPGQGGTRVEISLPT
ncbi:MAG: ATP-binding protein [Acidobacteriota bacterium]